MIQKSALVKYPVTAISALPLLSRMESCSSSDELLSDVDHPLSYEQYRALRQKGATPPRNGYVLCTTSGESEPEDGEEDADLASMLQDIPLKMINRPKKKGKRKGKKKPAAPRKLST